MFENIDDTIKRLDECYAYVNNDRQIPGDPFWMVANAEIVNAYPALRAEIARPRKIEEAANEMLRVWDTDYDILHTRVAVEKLRAALAGEGGGR